ncbi:HalOD1 output domain-containing protein [Halegenticoccus soli]|uniref:HalOD1 output domain-containing protein n=1 Tax=Halegenticoccus soli TaxID=1985678 RepID=UPI000C6D9E52|nr:HalOD1 output domain-containing protein [Halegenticoccus soli]
MQPVQSDAEAHYFTSEEDGELSVDIVTAVAAVKGVDPLEMRPLNDVLDGDALDQLIRSMATDADGAVSFRLAGCDVYVHADGGIVVYGE